MHKYYCLNELREMFLSFFESKGHLRLPSFPLVPENDPSLLLINAGMSPMKPWFKGEEEPPRRRVCTCQKCIRTGDIENIGHTARHGTYFEMLGNFSFGDYFKKEAIAWSWEFLTSPEWVGLEADRLYPSVFEGNETTPADDEAFRIWNEEIGIPAERIFKFGKEDNFWEHGSGPCGPCSEIYYDRGPEWGCGKPTCTVGCDCDRYIEVWNIVFSQFDNDGEGHYTELKQKNIDTGMGLERLAVVCQNVPSLFDVDTVMNITNKVSDITGAHYGDSQASDVSLRIITDHIRSATFMICDGVLPSNEGRGYVLRRLLRRAAIMRAHTATHLLDKALRTVLGDHVHQAGSLVEPDRLRFDFTHFSALTAEELAQVSAMVNEAVLEGYDVVTEELPIEQAKKKGAIALFGEKYGDVVRVVDMGEGYSVEFCGGTHLSNTAKVGLFHIGSEFSVASGVRRIEATTGKLSLEVMNRNQELLFQAAEAMKAKPGELREKAAAAMAEIKRLHQTIEKFEAEASLGQAQQFLTAAKEVGGLRVLTAQRPGLDGNALRQMGDFLRDKEPKVVAVLASTNEDKITFLAVCGKEAVAQGVKAGDLVKSVCAICGGKGGGKPDSAMGGGKDMLKLDDALASVDDFVAVKLGL